MTTGLIQSMEPLEGPSVDFVMLADRAEVLGGKLYVMGGAWDRLNIQDASQPALISFAVGVLVPWTATNQEHTLTIVIEDADGNPIGVRADAQFTMGRPAQAFPDTQRFLLAIPAMPIQFPRGGSYVVVATVNNHGRKRIPFRVISPEAAGAAPDAA